MEHFQPRAQIEVVGIAEDDLCLDILSELRHVDGLDGTHRPHWHKDRGEDLAMIGRDPPRTGSTLATGLMYIEVQHLFCLLPSYYRGYKDISSSAIGAKLI